ncbi:helix-turn-helix domain-containing protein [Phyllobacterium zundukense]|uniref:Helix-turn-helix domain-containing protein n=1 Tax=Phyllobacterium zundukense TaxID=1867719 RepID=A0ACD4CVV2_9HYPH|nr:helix-turn-helix domain-containing protein [Phyllobacterium zundukense]UXN57730.1 helix-turn-helix domain-containing protein [Phyllobacterium zundukense]
MAKHSLALEILPVTATEPLKTLGAHLRIARERRGDSLQSMAARIGTSIPTLRRMEAGDARVAIGIYAAALWVFGKSAALAEILQPGEDEYATMLDVDRASRKRATK